MSKDTQGQLLDDESPRPGESFLRRLHRRKTEARLNETTCADISPDENEDPTGAVFETAAETDGSTEETLTDADMPPLESLSADSDYTGFLSPKVSEKLRRAALRRLFHGDEFNIVDGLDEYAEDFTTFEALGDIVTSDMRHMIEVEARKKAEAIKNALLEDDGGSDTDIDETIAEELSPEVLDAQHTAVDVRPDPPFNPE